MSNQQIIITTQSVVEDEKPIIFAYHSKKGLLLLLSDDNITNDVDILTSTNFEVLLKKDSTLADLKDLPKGYIANRMNHLSEWNVILNNRINEINENFKEILQLINKKYDEEILPVNTLKKYFIRPGKHGLFGMFNLFIGVFAIIIGLIFYSQQNHTSFYDLVVPVIIGITLILYGYILLKK